MAVAAIRALVKELLNIYRRQLRTLFQQPTRFFHIMELIALLDMRAAPAGIGRTLGRK